MDFNASASLPNGTLRGGAVLLESKKPQKLLLLSDTHIGSGIYNSAHEREIITAMGKADHVVLNGDIFEMFYVRKKHTEDLASLIEKVRPGEKREDIEADFNHSKAPSMKVENVIKGAEDFFRAFLDAHPHTQLHCILGNHEKVMEYRKALDKLQRAYPGRFEWHPEAIRLGDALITHGHLPLSEKNDSEWLDYYAGQAESYAGWARAAALIDKPVCDFVGFVRKPDNVARKSYKQLRRWAEEEEEAKPLPQRGGFRYLHDGKEHVLRDVLWIKHLFLGHTHHKCHHDNEMEFKRDSHALHQWNTGSVTHGYSSRLKDLGILEATLLPPDAQNPYGSISGVSRAKLVNERAG